MNIIQIEYPLKKKIELIVELTDYKKSMAFKLWCEHYVSSVSYSANSEKCVYQLNVFCDDFTDCAKVETYLQTH